MINLVAKKVAAKKDANFNYGAALGGRGESVVSAVPAVAKNGPVDGVGAGRPAAPTPPVGEAQLNALGELLASATAHMAAVSPQLAAFGASGSGGESGGGLAAECQRYAADMQLVARQLQAAVTLGPVICD